MPPCLEAYLDIETTGLSPWDNEITVVGIHICSGAETRFIQLVGEDITADSLLEALTGVSVIYTFNGSRFDLLFISYRLGVDLDQRFMHHDLAYDCWRKNLYGGLKRVERKLDIKRRLTEIDGYEAARLWRRYVNDHDEDALKTLLEYNKEDVLNLKTLKERLR